MTISNRTIPNPDQIVIERRDLHTLTKRERFAAMAMQGLCANPADWLQDFLEEQIAEMAVTQADALLAELAKGKQG
jgi:hypothetical protein